MQRMNGQLYKGNRQHTSRRRGVVFRFRVDPLLASCHWAISIYYLYHRHKRHIPSTPTPKPMLVAGGVPLSIPRYQHQQQSVSHLSFSSLLDFLTHTLLEDASRLGCLLYLYLGLGSPVFRAGFELQSKSKYGKLVDGFYIILQWGTKEGGQSSTAQDYGAKVRQRKARSSSVLCGRGTKVALSFKSMIKSVFAGSSAWEYESPLMSFLHLRRN